MTQLPPKYNPAFTSDPDLVNQFVVRTSYLNLILDTIRENKGHSNQHVLVVGPRGIGKTTLVRRVAAEVRLDALLNEIWLPVIFAEEAYEVSSPGEFWLEALGRLADEVRSDKIHQIYSELKLESDDVRLRERSLGQLLAAAAESKKKILLIVENLNMLLGQQLDDQAAWDIRHTLVNEPGIMLLATGLSRFAAVENAGKAWFELFTTYNLEPLDSKDCGTLFHSVARKHLPAGQTRAMQILTGGNPRLVRILAEFSYRKSFRDLLADLTRLVDENTEYFKGQIDSLPPTERKVFASVLDIWEPASAQQIAENARLSVSKTSALLNRLVSRSAVSVVPSQGSTRRKLYQATERLYNIYYLVRKHGQPSSRVRAAVRFMTHFYRRQQMIESTADLAREACALDAASRVDLVTAYQEILATPLLANYRAAIIHATPKEFFEALDLPAELRHLATSESVGHMSLHSDVDVPHKVFELIATGEEHYENGDYEKAVEHFRQAVDLAPQSGHVLAHLARPLYRHLEKAQEAQNLLDRASTLSPKDWWVWLHKGLLARRIGDYTSAVSCLEESTRLKPTHSFAWSQLAYALHDTGRYEECERACLRAIEIGDKDERANGLALLAELYHNHLNRLDDAEKAYETAMALQDPERGDGALCWNYARLLESRGKLKSALDLYERAEQFSEKEVEEDPKDARNWYRLGQLYSRNPELASKAESAMRKSVELEPDGDRLWGKLAEFLISGGKQDEAEQVYRSALAINPDSYFLWYSLGDLLEDEEKTSEAEEAYQRAIETDSSRFEAELNLAEIKLNAGQTEAALRLLRASVSKGGWESPAWPALLTLQWRVKEISLADLKEKAEQYVIANGRDADILNRTALRLVGTDEPALIAIAEAFADESLANRNGFHDLMTCCTVYLAGQKWRLIAELLPRVFEGTAQNGDTIGLAIDFAVQTAGAGYANEVLEALVSSSARMAFEPLEVGIRYFLGKPLTAPKEISEVGQDIAKQIDSIASILRTPKEAQDVTD